MKKIIENNQENNQEINQEINQSDTSQGVGLDAKFDKKSVRKIFIDKYIKNPYVKNKTYFFTYLLLFVVTIILGYFIASNLTIILLLVLFLSIFNKYTKMMRQYEKEHFKKISVESGYEYNETKSLANLNGVLFTTGHGKVKDIFSIENTSFYDYEYTITNGSGKDRRSKTYYYVVSEIDIGCELPHILINNGELKQINYGSFTNIAEVNLPDNFEKKYNVTIDKGLEVELFQILTPDIMDLLLNKYTEYSIEICDSKIFLIKYGINSTDEKLSVKEKQLKELKILADILYDRFVAVSKYIKEHNKKQDTKKDYKNNISQWSDTKRAVVAGVIRLLFIVIISFIIFSWDLFF